MVPRDGRSWEKGVFVLFSLKSWYHKTFVVVSNVVVHRVICDVVSGVSFRSDQTTCSLCFQEFVWG